MVVQIDSLLRVKIDECVECALVNIIACTQIRNHSQVEVTPSMYRDLNRQ